MTGLESELKDFDVNETPFFTYMKNVGYEIEDLPAVLYLNAIRNPGAIYFGAVNTEFGSQPVLRQYLHVAVFFPWFSDDGDFHLSVMDTGLEKSAVALEGQFPGGYIQLVQIKGVEKFSPPVVKK